MNREIAVNTENLTRRFGSFRAVDRVSIRVERGEIFGFLGANGAGKTTMIRMLCGLLKPSQGRATVAGFDVYSQTEKIKQNIGYMSQKFSLYEDLTIEENIIFYGGVYGLNRHSIQQKKQEVLDNVNLRNWAAAQTGQLPLGFKQRLALGCAMLHDPPIVFLDEPTSGVDPAARRAFWEVIHQTAAAGTTVFVTTHFMDEAEYCHRISIMSAGKVIALDTPENLKTQYGQASIHKVFLDLVKKENLELNSARPAGPGINRFP